MTKKERIEALERRVAELEAHPAVQFIPYVPQWVPVPALPYIAPGPIWISRPTFTQPGSFTGTSHGPASSTTLYLNASDVEQMRADGRLNYTDN